jgi:hypothetical protein
VTPFGEDFGGGLDVAFLVVSVDIVELRKCLESQSKVSGALENDKLIIDRGMAAMVRDLGKKS